MKNLLVLLLVTSLLHTACVSTGPSSPFTPDHPMKTWLQQQSRSKKGALLGAAAGALLGLARARVLGHDPIRGAVGGAVAGALVGFLAGRHQDKVYGSRDEAVALLGYQPTQGYVFAVQEVRFEPHELAPGATTEVVVRWLVVGPDSREDLAVRSYLGVKFDGEYIHAQGPGQTLVPRGGGLVETRSVLTIPKDAAKGSYAIEHLFEDPAGRFKTSAEGPLYVS